MFNPPKVINGYVTLISVLVVGVVGVATVTSLILLGLGSSRTSFAVEQSVRAKAAANACAEEGLQKIRDLPTFSGTASLSFGQGGCNFTVENLGVENRRVTASGSAGSVVRRVEITIDKINPQINIVSWQEVADF